MKKSVLLCLLALMAVFHPASYDVTQDGMPTPDAEGFVFDKGTITGYTGNKTAIVIPAAIGGVPVTAIGERAFDGNPIFL